MKIEVIATCGCVCNLRAEYNNVEQSLMDVEINIVAPCNYHAAQQSVHLTAFGVCPHGVNLGNQSCCVCEPEKFGGR